MAKYVKCITKPNPSDPRRRITHIGGDGWQVTQEQAILDIKVDPNSYYTHYNGKSAWLRVYRSAQGNEYIRTEDDDESQNNLLSLPQCPLRGYLAP
jgi:hypothetical protein